MGDLCLCGGIFTPSLSSDHARRTTTPQFFPQGPPLQPAGRPTTGLRQTRSNSCVLPFPAILTSNLHSVFALRSAIYRNAVFPELVKPQPGESALTIHEIFLSGMATGADRPCLGWRERISSNPVKFASKYEWLSYARVNERRLNLGSAIEALFRSGRAGGGELPTVGIWCQNRPGAFGLPYFQPCADTRAIFF